MVTVAVAWTLEASPDSIRANGVSQNHCRFSAKAIWAPIRSKPGRTPLMNTDP